MFGISGNTPQTCSLTLRIATPELAMNGFQVQETLSQIVLVGSYPRETSLFVYVKSENMLSYIATSLAILAITWQSSTYCLAVWSSIQDAASFFEVDSSTSKSTATWACPMAGCQQKHKQNGHEWQNYSQGPTSKLNIKPSGFHSKSWQIRLIAVDA